MDLSRHGATGFVPAGNRPRRGEPTRVLTRRDTLRRAAGLAFGVVTYMHVRHLGMTEPAHALLDGALALPLGLVSVRVAQRLRSPSGRALTAGLLFSALLVPAAWVHGFIDAATAPAGMHTITAATTGFGHSVRDAVTALPVALLLASVGLRRRLAFPRRRWALAAAVAVFGATLPLPAAFAALPTPFSVAMPTPPVLTGPNMTLTADEADVPILPGAPTKMWTYNGTFPGPTIRVPSGTPINVKVENRLDTAGSLTLHHHGNHSTPANDGQPDSHLIAPASDLTYTYGLTEGGATTPERPAMQWYHDHRMEATARNVWMGLAGMVILDPAPDDLLGQQLDQALPSGAYDVPIMIADRTFDASNQIPYTFDVNGVFGNLILANGAPQPYLNVEPRKYRIRLLNASNTRPYQLAIDGLSMTQIGTESGMLPEPVPRASLRLDPAERAEVVLDFKAFGGQNLVMKNTLGFGPGVAQVMQFRVSSTPVNDPSTVPSPLRPVPDFGDAVALPSVNEDGNIDHLQRVWLLTQTGLDTPQWTINGQGFESSRIDAKPVLGTIENWVFVNTTSVEHVVHIHDVDWRILLRTGGLPPTPAIDQPELPLPPIDPSEVGLKESFLVRAFEVVEVAARFTDHLGTYVFHCHVLEHEDHAMMAQFKVVEPGIENQLPL
jgi:FtsP/CotA-like multicopper oxidase with cupredoxin domain